MVFSGPGGVGFVRVTASDLVLIGCGGAMHLARSGDLQGLLGALGRL